MSFTLRANSSPSEPPGKPHISAYLSGFDISVYLISDISKPDKKVIRKLKNYQWFFHRTRAKKSQKLYGDIKDPKLPKQS